MLYLLQDKFFEDDESNEDKDLNREKHEKIERLKFWLNENPVDVKDNQSQADSFSDVIRHTNAEEYLQGFLDAYLGYYTTGNGKLTRIASEIIRNIQARLIYLYSQKENPIQAERVEKAYARFLSRTEGRSEKARQKDAEKFVTASFFQGHLYKKTNQQVTCLQADSILEIMKENTSKFRNRVINKSIKMAPDSEFTATFSVLRRWNSFTPTLTSSINSSKGGGYFMHFSYGRESLGVVIDPGYNFLENFFSMGLNIADIDYILVSHGHPDHNDNLPQILSLFHEANGKLGKSFSGSTDQNNHLLTLIISEGVFNQFYSGFIKPNEKSLENIIVLKSYTKKNELEVIRARELKGKETYAVEIRPITTGHQDLLDASESFGFIFEIKHNGRCWRKIGYTSDARWNKRFYEKFSSCNIVCAHLGSLVDILNDKSFCDLCGGHENTSCPDCRQNRFKNGNATTEKLLKQTNEQNHLYLSGLVLFFDKLLPGRKKKSNLELAVISEFGEELKGGLRMDLYKKLNDWFLARTSEKEKKAVCLPGDIGLEINAIDSSIYCSSCHRFKPRIEISPVPYGREEAICFVCSECEGVLSTYQIGEKLKHYCENGKLQDPNNEQA